MALRTRRWTRADLERLPDDTNRYEVIHGELLVSAMPRPAHEAVVYALRRALDDYCARQELGRVAENQAFVTRDSETIPDLIVRRMPVPPDRWDDAPAPCLVVEVLSGSTRRADEVKKRAFYMESGIPEYWIVDGKSRTVSVITKDGRRVEAETLCWQPAGAVQALDIDLPRLFTMALGPR